MKTILKSGIAGLVLLIVFLQPSHAQSPQKSDTVTIQTSAVCGQCKDRIEQGLAFEKGIKNATLDQETKKVTVIYNPSKTNADAIRRAIAKLGYDADRVAADPKAYVKLPPCCKKDQPRH